MRRILKIMVWLAVFLVSAIGGIVASGAALSIPTTHRANASAACNGVKIGMTFPQMNGTIHREGPFFHESANFTKSEFVYSGSGGSCSVNMSLDGTQVTKVAFDPEPQYRSKAR
jgi:hypothetical protein